MYAIERTEPTQECNQLQAFLPIVATLFFAALTAPILMGWRGHESSGLGITRNGTTGSQVVITRCELIEHRHADPRCMCRG
jgi:hypothetical protein